MEKRLVVWHRDRKGQGLDIVDTEPGMHLMLADIPRKRSVQEICCDEYAEQCMYPGRTVYEQND